jgi:hypothetical protein
MFATSDVSAIKTAQQIIADFGFDLIGLVNNAGIWRKNSSTKFPMPKWLLSNRSCRVINFTKAILPHLRLYPKRALSTSPRVRA